MPMTKSSARDLFPGALEMMILQSLRRQPAHGYALVQHIQQRSNNLLQVEEGSLYPALHRLIKRRWISVEEGTSENNRRAKFYALTSKGKQQLAVEIGRWDKLARAIAQILRPGEQEEA